MLGILVCVISGVTTFDKSLIYDYEPDARTSVVGVCDQFGLKPTYSATETSQINGNLAVASSVNLPSIKRMIKVLIKLHACAG